MALHFHQRVICSTNPESNFNPTPTKSKVLLAGEGKIEIIFETHVRQILSDLLFSRLCRYACITFYRHQMYIAV